MTTHDRVRLQLQALEALLREHQHWRNDEPQPHHRALLPLHPIMKWRWRRTIRNARLFWLSWKNWMLFLRMMRANAGNTLSG